jgi:hypothetical protein
MYGYKYYKIEANMFRITKFFTVDGEECKCTIEDRLRSALPDVEDPHSNCKHGLYFDVDNFSKELHFFGDYCANTYFSKKRGAYTYHYIPLIWFEERDEVKNLYKRCLEVFGEPEKRIITVCPFSKEIYEALKNNIIEEIPVVEIDEPYNK